jgi:hypothetical protein
MKGYTQAKNDLQGLPNEIVRRRKENGLYEGVGPVMRSPSLEAATCPRLATDGHRKNPEPYAVENHVKPGNVLSKELLTTANESNARTASVFHRRAFFGSECVADRFTRLHLSSHP